MFQSPKASGKGRGRTGKGRGRFDGRKGHNPWASVMGDADAKPTASWFRTDVEAAYVASVRLPHGASLLVDMGSPGNLCGDGWSEEMAAESQRIGRNPEHLKRDRTMTCRGIGAGAQSTDWDVRHSISLGNGRLDTYTAPELPNSHEEQTHIHRYIH